MGGKDFFKIYFNEYFQKNNGIFFNADRTCNYLFINNGRLA